VLLFCASSAMPYSEADYRDAHGVIVMCMHCRRTRRETPEGEVWERVDEHLSKRPRNVSDGICHECLEEYYPQ
jgi:hypothetical protein